MDKLDRQERLERTASMAYNKGLINNPGENNCFLNSAVQVLWHLDVFRRSFREIKGHYCMGQSCIFCALDFIFKQFQYSNNDALPPDGLRIALAVAFKNQHRFQLGDMDDAAECFENILCHMHMLVARNEKDDACTAKHCISHQKFAMQIIEQTSCHCGELSEPFPFFQLVHYVSASALCAKAKNLKGWDNARQIENHFGVLLRRAGQDTRECQSPDCKDKVQVQRLLLNCPDIVSVGLIWDSESPDAEHIADVLHCIGTTLKLSDLYHRVCDDNAKDACLQLVGLVTYYGKHYSTFFFHSKLRTWIYFDDARVREIGSDWSLMMEKCRLCHYQPLLLLYANPRGTPINAETAPKERICINENGEQETEIGAVRGQADGTSDGEKSPSTSKKSKLRLKIRGERKSLFKSKKSLSSGDLTQPGVQLARTSSNASDSVGGSPSKDKSRPSFRRIGNAIMSAVNPNLAVTHLKREMTKKSKRRSSTGSGSESSGEPDLIDLGPSNEEAKLEIMRLYEQSKALNAAQSRAVNNADSGISSAPSSAGGSVSSTDTNHGGSDEDLIEFNSTWRHSSYDNWPPGHGQVDRISSLLQEAERYLEKSENCERKRDFVGALSCCTEAAGYFLRVTEENGVDHRTVNYASRKRNDCQTKARLLRHYVQAPPTFDNRTPSVNLPKQRAEEVLRQQRHREEMNIRQQQHSQAAPLPYVCTCS
ncbi:inactive ubiquitin carboxyl-terminal hydrolase 54-like [Acropora millepora]|uniref:inactive ubiquitin carboxyl-terminal hydrolase 54-like n=1 Tax=Acropora millepora TaxID=45264 RepID=UPI001CF5B7EC|nr:inactive ubiquitin carboxyl-terminal hydrolase 54-like [Acropora millepora]